MSEKRQFVCDVCGHAITEGHQLLYMATVRVERTGQCDDGSAAGTEDVTEKYHVHNDFSNHCMGKVWDVLVKNRK